MSASTSRTVRVGTRRSLLATTQSGHVATMVEGLGMPTELVEITTDGDRSQAAGTSLVGSASTGVFVNA
ncbi:MAG: hydroxymethylbilane synthase, partial [Actinomycetota bacterium]|nr:hydroxymethylbilane synthase [Actinomycetota bacterium]